MAMRRTALVCVWLWPLLASAGEVGWHDDFRVDRGWRAEPWQVDTPDEKARVPFDAGSGSFEVVSPRSGMAWTRTVNPIWIEAFPILEVDCACHGSPASGFPQLFLSDDSTGPVTPNALNPENPLAGEHEAIVTLAPGPGVQTFDLRKLYPSDRIARITIRLVSADAQTSVVMNKLVFRAADARPITSQPFDSVSAGTLLARSGAVGAAWKNVELPKPPAGESAPWTTGIMEEESLDVAGRWQGSELALVLASRVYGNSAPWYGPGSSRPRKSITSPHQLIVDLEYEDGTRTSHFPWSVERKAWQIDPEPAVYVISVDPVRTLTGFRVRDRMSYGQVALLAAAINTLENRIHPLAAKPSDRTTVASPVVSPVPTKWSREGNSVLIQNAWLRLRLDVTAGPRIVELSVIPLNRTVIDPGSNSALFEFQGEVGQARFQEVSGDKKSSLEMTWTLDGSADRHLALKLHAGDDGRLEFSAALRNAAASAWNVSLSAPALRSVTVAAEAHDAFYLVGTRSALLGSGDVSIDRPYGGPWPLPLVDLFAHRGHGGLGLFVLDPQVLAKTLHFKQKHGKADVLIAYDNLSVSAGGRVELPPTVIMPHLGDWHDAFAAYRARVQVSRKTSLHALSDAFYCRRDYPLGGTHYLFDAASRTYTPETLIDESQAAFGGLDLIDISGWAFHEKTGRVGDYLTNDLGGLPAVRELTEQAQRAGKRVGLYFEGFLIDRRSPLAARALPAWQIIDEAGKPRWWSGEMEFFTCPGVKEWQAELSRTMARVARETGVDAVYADQLGISTMNRACWSPDHGHPVPSNPLCDEREMLQAVRAALAAESPRTALYTEYVPADGLAGLVDGAFDISLFDANPGQHPTRLPLYRYVFPQIAVFQMVGHGIRPVPFEADNLHLAVFHGQGPWLKGRGESWFTTELRDLARRAYRMFDAHGEVFRSADCEPLIPTLQPGLYANRFAANGKTIYTLYNAGYSTIRGELLQFPSGMRSGPTDLFWSGDAAITAGGRLTGTVAPRSVAAYLCEPN